MKTYAEACGVARALDLVGERWTVLVIRELLMGPKRFTDLEAGLPGVPSSLLGARLRELQQAGLVHRRRLPPPAASMVYELTATGAALDETVMALARWGARFGRERSASDATNPEWGLFALRSFFRPEAARNLRARYELRFEDGVLTVEVAGGALRVVRAPAQDADVAIALDHATFIDLAARRMQVDEALASGRLGVDGEVAKVRQLFEIFSAEPRGQPTTFAIA
jgi:DNA-binding HxlR family transcriptional regulator